MEPETWRDRLRAAVEASGLSKRAISKKAAMGSGYVFSLLDEGKDPTLDNLLKVCAVLDVSLLRIVYGLDVTPEVEEVFQLWRQASPETRAGIVQILRSSKGSESVPKPPTAQPESARSAPRKARAK